MTISAAGIILGLLAATAYGAAFHLLMGGSARHIPIYILASWIGFAVGQFVGDALHFSFLQLGAIRLLPASVGSWAILITAWLLLRFEERRKPPVV